MLTHTYYIKYVKRNNGLKCIDPKIGMNSQLSPLLANDAGLHPQLLDAFLDVQHADDVSVAPGKHISVH